MSITPEKLEKFFKMKLAAEIGPNGLKCAIESKETFTILDVRKAEDYKAGHIPGAVNIPLSELEKQYKKISKKEQVYVYCGNLLCRASLKAAYLLSKKGYLAATVTGGYEEYAKVFPTKGPKFDKVEASKSEPVAA
jgi:rhodanese-related sulfurtransferase